MKQLTLQVPATVPDDFEEKVEVVRYGLPNDNEWRLTCAGDIVRVSHDLHHPCIIVRPKPAPWQPMPWMKDGWWVARDDGDKRFMCADKPVETHADRYESPIGSPHFYDLAAIFPDFIPPTENCVRVKHG